jgi:membrane protein YqaA with SNARE-associated domain
LIALSLVSPEKSFYYALIATLGSIFGGGFVYLIGRKGGLPILKKLFKKEKITAVHNLYQKYEAYAIGFAAFTPIPYKVFTISAGVFFVDFKKFLLFSILGRAGRFFLVALFIFIFGEEIKFLLDKYFGIFTLVFAVLLIGGFYFVSFVTKKKLKKEGV